MSAARETAIEFAGWMPVFERFGDCGRHPLFAHTNTPPAGYHFAHSDPRSRPKRLLHRLAEWLGQIVRPVCSVLWQALRHGPGRCCIVLAAALMLFCRLIARGHGVLPAARFVHSRHFESQVLLPRSDLVFLTSVPYTYGQSPWVIEIEDSTSLFHPFVHNGETGVMNPQQSPYFAMVRDLLESDRCRAIITHMRSTAESLARLFDRETITSKVFHIPLGVRTPPRLVRRKTRSTIDLLFTNSWHQDPRSFFLRGGLDVLEAFSILRERYPQLRLTLRTSIPPLAPRHRRMLMQDGIRVLGNFLADEQMEELLEQTAIFVLPAARVHIVSVLRAMAHAQAVIVSDGWGFDELIDHERTGLIVPGRSGKTSWLEPNTGILREDYRPLFEPDPVVVEGLIEAVSRLVEDADLCERLGQSARAHVEENHSLERWNAGLKAVFDQVAPRR